MPQLPDTTVEAPVTAERDCPRACGPLQNPPPGIPLETVSETVRAMVRTDLSECLHIMMPLRTMPKYRVLVKPPHTMSPGAILVAVATESTILAA